MKGLTSDYQLTLPAMLRHVIENETLDGEVIRLDAATRLAPR